MLDYGRAMESLEGNDEKGQIWEARLIPGVLGG
jgi:hypothetical protein